MQGVAVAVHDPLQQSFGLTQQKTLPCGMHEDPANAVGETMDTIEGIAIAAMPNRATIWRRVKPARNAGFAGASSSNLNLSS